ncbi:MAG: fumarylacetoacetate hydrolase family protein [Solirubrobacterales bacterium]|nr:fumarylacetoacetate hydrolase family protein [Solirubrobacterales bacterium]
MNAQRAAEVVWEAWSSGRPLAALPEELRPRDLEQGYVIQRALDDLAGRPVGWKIAATSPAGQRHLGADGPMVGRLYEMQHRPSGSVLSVGAMQMRSAEPEFAFRFGAPVSAGERGALGVDEVLKAVDSLVLAIEVPDSRFADFSAVGVPSLAADAMCGGYFLLGPAIEDWRSLDLAGQAARLTVGGEEVSSGSGAAVLGDPRDALAWMANQVLDHGWDLRQGDIVLTGASAPPIPVHSGDEVVAEFEGLGSLEVRFEA